MNTREKGILQQSMTWLPPQVTVLGAARSGLAAARFLVGRGIDVLVSDSCSPQKLDQILDKNKLSQVRKEAGGHTDAALQCGLIILSPGIPSDIPLLVEARRRAIPVWSEIELAWRHSSAPYIAVTGSTGKSTTVSLMGAVAASAGREHVVAGNIGIPLIEAAPKIAASGLVIAEISSFQLETIDCFKPRVAVILNFMKNHLDRYSSEMAYYNAKKEIVRNMDRGATVILNANDTLLRAWADEITDRFHVVLFGQKVAGFDSVWCEGTSMKMSDGPIEHVVMDTSTLFIKGKHNIENASVAAAAAYFSGITIEAIAAGCASFPGLSHRLEFVRTLDNVSYYNDSKATTAESIACAVASFGKNVHLIAGGRDKGCDFAAVKGEIRNHVKSVCVIGEAQERIAGEWNGLTLIHRAPTLADAVMVCKNSAVDGDVVVLSPGCSSFDMFSSFEERGEVFKTLVHALPVEKKTW